MKSNGIKTEENPQHSPHLNLIIGPAWHLIFSDPSRWGPDSVSLLGWKQEGREGRRICACFSKSERSVRRIYIHLGELREEKGCFWKMFSASTIFYAWETAYLNSQRFNTLPPMLNTLIIGLALPLKALFIIWIKPGGIGVVGPISERLRQSVPLPCLGVASSAGNVEPGSGKTILFYCTGTWLC